jgi:pilus assembly protein TadC
VSVALALAAVILWSTGSAPRLRRVLGEAAPAHRASGPARLAVWLMALLLVPLPWALAVGWAAAAVLAWALQRVPPRQPTATVEVAIALDLMAACLRSGAAPDRAAESVSRSLAEPTATALARAARALRSGVDATAAWSDLLAVGGESAAIARSALTRSLGSGSGLAEALERAAEHMRRTAAVDMQARLHASTVRVVLPLALCFLPAFVLVGVVPIVAGIASGLF